MNTVKLWYVEYCENNLGLWNRGWFDSEEEADECYRQLLAEHGGPREELCGNYGDAFAPQAVFVPPNADGILGFARDYATGSSE
jgi:hypothetical protein